MRDVRLGFFSFTEITDRHEHRSYNEWHMLDHMPEQFQIEGVAWGQRWVSTPACTAARAAGCEPLAAIHYVTCYLMTEPLDATLREFYALGRDLSSRGRFHQHRVSHLSGPFMLDARAVAPRVLVRADVVPFRPHRGVYVVVEPVDNPVAVDDLVGFAGVAGAWSFVTTGAPDGHPWVPGARRVTVCYLDESPTSVASAIGERATQAANVEFAGPFETITPWKWDWFE